MNKLEKFSPAWLVFVVCCVIAAAVFGTALLMGTIQLLKGKL